MITVLILKNKFSEFIKVFLTLNQVPLREDLSYAYGGVGSEGITPRILNFGSIQRGVVTFMTQPLYSRRKNTRRKLDRRLDGPQSGLNAMPLPGI
jgi:hypothetical protein